MHTLGHTLEITLNLYQSTSIFSAAWQGRSIFLSLGHALKYDTRWAGETGKLAPDQFNPERWLSEEGQKTGAFLPFGSGQRMCVGYLLAQAEMKVCPSYIHPLHTGLIKEFCLAATRGWA